MDMKSRKEIIKTYYPGIREMYERGYLLKDIAAYFGIHPGTVYNAVRLMGLPGRKPVEDDTKLIYADSKIVLEKMFINGKSYTDITPLIAYQQ